jgi:hypothetical protein
MRKWYVPHFEPDLAVTHLGGRDPRKLEMSFDCTAFQAQLPKDKPFDDHVFQTIFLNKKHEQTWSMHEIDPAKISTSSTCSVPACPWLMGVQSESTGGTSCATRGRTTCSSCHSCGRSTAANGQRTRARGRS